MSGNNQVMDCTHQVFFLFQKENLRKRRMLLFFLIKIKFVKIAFWKFKAPELQRTKNQMNLMVAVKITKLLTV